MTYKPLKEEKQTLIELDPVQGCRDFPPNEMRLRKYLFNVFHETAKEFGFEEYDAPILESEKLYIRKQGEEITGQLFNFTTKGNHAVALRPEMTPTLARLILAKGKALMYPAKWYSIAQCWRYECISKGRKREHYQWNMDIVGVKSVTAEAEIVCAICTSLVKLGLTSNDIGVRVNSRQLLQSVITELNIHMDKFQAVCTIIDKLDKIGLEEVQRLLKEEQLTTQQILSIIEFIQCNDLALLKGKYRTADASLVDLDSFFSYVESYGFSEWIVLDTSVVRGLSYYTGIVFEVFDKQKSFRAVAGGGRYNHLLSLFGSPEPIPCCGFGYGDCVIMELLKEKNLLPKLKNSIECIVIPFNEHIRPAAISVLAKLRHLGVTTDIVLDKKKVTAAFNYADRIQAKYAVLVAPKEWNEQKVVLKNLRKEGSDRTTTDMGETISIEDLLTYKF